MGFSNLKGKTPFGAGSYINDNGEFIIQVVKNLDKQSTQNKGKYFFITEFKILESSEPDKVKVGSNKSQSIDVMTDWGAADAVAFLAAAAGLDAYSGEDGFQNHVIKAYEEAFDAHGLDFETIAYMVCDESQPLEGTKLLLKTINRPHKACKDMSPEDPNYKFFTKHMWYPYDDSE